MLFYQTILRNPKKIVIAVILAVTVFFGWQAVRVEVNNSIILPQDHEAVAQDREINSRGMILIGELHDEGIFNPCTLQKVQDLTREVEGLTITPDDDERRLEAWGRREQPLARRPRGCRP